MIGIRSSKPHLLEEPLSDDDYIIDYNEEDPQKIDFANIRDITEIQLHRTLSEFLEDHNRVYDRDWLFKVNKATSLGFKHLRKGVLGGGVWQTFNVVANCLKQARKSCISRDKGLAEYISEFFKEIMFQTNYSQEYKALAKELGISMFIEDLNAIKRQHAEEFNNRAKALRKARKNKRKRSRRSQDPFEAVELPKKRAHDEISLTQFADFNPQLRFQDLDCETLMKMQKAKELTEEEWSLVDEVVEEGEVLEKVCNELEEFLAFSNANLFVVLEPPIEVEHKEAPKLSKERPIHLQHQSLQRTAFKRMKTEGLANVFEDQDSTMERLVLFLDIDNTLLQCVNQDQLQSQPDLKFDIRQVTIANERRFLVLRPEVKKFLERVSKFCQLWIYTLGKPEYAATVAQKLDPAKKYFGDRVISATTDEETREKVLSRAKQFTDFDETMAVIVDDRCDVWTRDSHCVLRSKKFAPYIDPKDNDIFVYYNKKQQFSDVKGWSKETSSDRPQLIELAHILESLYTRFIETDAKFNLHYLLFELRQQTLEGLNLCFDRYEERLSLPSYSQDKMMTLMRIAKDLGGCKGLKLQVVEEVETEDEVSTAWLMDCSFYLSNS